MACVNTSRVKLGQTGHQLQLAVLESRHSILEHALLVPEALQLGDQLRIGHAARAQLFAQQRPQLRILTEKLADQGRVMLVLFERGKIADGR